MPQKASQDIGLIGSKFGFNPRKRCQAPVGEKPFDKFILSLLHFCVFPISPESSRARVDSSNTELSVPSLLMAAISPTETLVSELL
jgi:hypothetical protein